MIETNRSSNNYGDRLPGYNERVAYDPVLEDIRPVYP